MKKIAVVAGDVALPGEKGLGRIYYIASLLAGAGFEVELITSSFQHWEKKSRSEETVKKFSGMQNPRVTFIKTGTYKKNIDLARIISLNKLADRTYAYLIKQRYDLIYALVPDNRLAYMAGRAAKKTGCPFVTDTEDLWPEAMRMVLDIPLVSDIVFYPFKYYAEKCYALADAAIGSSDDYAGRPVKFGIDVPRRLTVFVGSETAWFDEGIKINKDNTEKFPGDFIVAYAGTLGESYDLETLIYAVDKLNKKGYNDIRLLILGDGPDRQKLQELAKSTNTNAVFTGFLDYGLMAAYLSDSSVTVNSLVEKAAQSIVSKIGDYLAAGIPMINTGVNPEFTSMTEKLGFGLNVRPGDPEALADAILKLYKNPGICSEMGRKARTAAEELFDREKTYVKIVGLIKELTD